MDNHVCNSRHFKDKLYLICLGMEGCTELLLAQICGAVHRIWCIIKCTYSASIFENTGKLKGYLRI